jgi:hypothetical protein
MDLFGSVGFFVWMIGAGLTALVLTLLVRMGALRPAA